MKKKRNDRVARVLAIRQQFWPRNRRGRTSVALIGAELGCQPLSEKIREKNVEFLQAVRPSKAK